MVQTCATKQLKLETILPQECGQLCLFILYPFCQLAGVVWQVPPADSGFVWAIFVG